MINYPQKQCFMMVYGLIVWVSVWLSCKSRWSGSSRGRRTEWINQTFDYSRNRLHVSERVFSLNGRWFVVFWDGNLLLLKCFLLWFWSVFDSISRGNEVARLNMQHMQQTDQINCDEINRYTWKHACRE